MDVALNNPPVTPEAIFLRFAVTKLDTLTARILAAQRRLSDDQFRAAPNEASNSVANLLLHLSGNTRQWILSGIMGEADNRDRDSEFAAPTHSRAEILDIFESTLIDVQIAIQSIPAGRLVETVTPQGYELPVLEAVFHVTEHFSYHSGQIFMLVKMFTNEDLAFYKNLSKSNKLHKERLP